MLIAAVLEAGPRDLEVVSNNCGVDDWGLGVLLRNGRISRVVASYVGGTASWRGSTCRGSWNWS